MLAIPLEADVSLGMIGLGAYSAYEALKKEKKRF
jgi:hypothetical protein